jgi:hypothetical protein
MKTQRRQFAASILALVFGIGCAQSAFPQSFKKVSVKGGAKMTQVASGGAGVWALATNGNPYVYKTNKFLLASTISLTQIAVGGGNLRQPDTVWALDSAGNVYNASISGTTWVFNQAPGVLSQIAVGIGYEDSCHPYEVWGLNPSALIYRFNYCLGNWEFIPGTLQTISVGAGDVYGINGNHQIFHFKFQNLSFEQIASKYDQHDQISVGPNGVWALQNGSNPMELEFPNTTVFADLSQVLGFSLVQGGGDGVWALDSSGRIYLFRRAEWHLVQIPGLVFRTLSVGSGAGVWGIDFNGQVYAFSTR